MADFTLGDIQKAAEKKYKGISVELPGGFVVELRNLIRLTDAERSRFQAIQESNHDDINQQFVDVREMLTILADTQAGAENLLTALGDDNGSMVELIDLWMKETQAGEARPSES